MDRTVLRRENLIEGGVAYSYDVGDVGHFRFELTSVCVLVHARVFKCTKDNLKLFREALHKTMQDVLKAQWNYESVFIVSPKAGFVKFLSYGREQLKITNFYRDYHLYEFDLG